jgi:polysaccharide pyruvyl transferase WcaK-like protein
MSAPDFYLLHAYSSHNSGDGVLVELSLKAIREAGVKQRVTVVCLDKASFAGYLSDSNVKLISLWEFTLRQLYGVVSRRNTIFFGVGGGYLRASSKSEGWKSLIAHGSQILMSTIGGRSRRIYFPQSVGPFKTRAGKILAYLVRHYVERIFLRDDKSLLELNHQGASRTGDLVVLEIARHTTAGGLRRPEPSMRRVYLVFRDLQNKPYRDAYLERIRSLLALLPDARLAVQSRRRGNSDDVFYRDCLGVSDAVLLKDVLAEGEGIVVSVRLHGSLESILAGVPSVHLAYERKGLAAFTDLGLQAFAFHASDFSPQAVVAAVQAIIDNEEHYWTQVEGSVQRSRQQFVEAIQDELRTFANLSDGR